MDDSASLDESVENLDRGSLASFGSGNTTDSDKVGSTHLSLWLVYVNTELKSSKISAWHDLCKIL